MAAISLRLPDDLEARLDREVAVQGAPRSEVARAAIEEFLDRRERERLVGAFVAERALRTAIPRSGAKRLRSRRSHSLLTMKRWSGRNVVRVVAMVALPAGAKADGEAGVKYGSPIRIPRASGRSARSVRF